MATSVVSMREMRVSCVWFGHESFEWFKRIRTVCIHLCDDSLGSVFTMYVIIKRD